VDSVQKFFANTLGLQRAREILHDLPLVNFKLCGKLPEAAGRNDSLGNLPFAFLPCTKIRSLFAGFSGVQPPVREFARIAIRSARRFSSQLPV